MEEIYLVLFLKETAYGERLLRFLAGKKNPKLHLELMTERVQVEIRQKEERVVILTDDISLESLEKQGERKKVLYLAAEQNRSGGFICQYQKAEEIYEELIWQLGLEKQEVTEEETMSPVGIYGVFSTESKVRTEFAYQLSQELGKQGKTIYLCLSAFPSYFQKEINFSEPGLSDLLFLVQDEIFPEKVRMWRQDFGVAETLLPWKHSKDMWDISQEEWELFLRRLQKECEYSYIVLEMGELFENVWEIMDFCDRHYFLVSQGESGKRQKEIFQRYCHIEQKEELEKRTEYVENLEASWEEEDVCILEGFE